MVKHVGTDSKYKDCTVRDFQGIVFHTILPSPMWIEDCRKQARSLSHREIQNVCEVSRCQKRKSVFRRDLQQCLQQVCKQRHPNFVFVTIWCGMSWGTWRLYSCSPEKKNFFSSIRNLLTKTGFSQTLWSA